MTPEPGTESASMDQAAGEAMRLAAELVAVGTMAVAQRTRQQQRDTEIEHERVLAETGRDTQPEQERRIVEEEAVTCLEEERRPWGPRALREPTPAELEEFDRQEAYAREWEQGPDGPEAQAATQDDGELLREHGAPYTESSLARERGAELAGSATVPPAEAARALVDAGAQPTSPENLAAAVARASAQPKPARAVGLGRSPLPGHDLSR